ncbi:hypothetical protein UK23_42505 [Lentzea aerocolonigenes]|uniref:Trypsin-co-occurring domain-containing protein n=1 Tax=Lentzea aerocolonigenes TaxID=68170 RepID=A0A0F0GDG5_LENAE|nr:trypco2 family protein [Lentzea aerocolonigenes]KJK35944.1 hypothetical protein UK23_42505 [Lentzea aerocolonigenes]
MTGAEHDGQVLIDHDGIALSTAIELLRSELAESIEAGKNERIRFTAESIELELEITAKLTRKANGKVSLWKVMSVGAAREHEGAAKHRLKVLLKPHDTSLPQGAETLIGDYEE